MGRVGWVGWGWWRFFHLHTCDMLWTWRFLHLHTGNMLRKSWAGLGGWGGDDDVSFTCTHVTCYGLDVSCTCTQVTCYASHGEGWVGGVGMMTFLSLAQMWHATQVMGRVGWVGWGWWRFFHLHTCDMLRTWRFVHLHTCDMQWTWKSESKRRSVKFASVSHNKMQFTKWHSKTRLTGTQALDKVWSHLKKHVPKSLCSRSKSDRRFHPRMEQYVYSYMWRFNNRNWWKQLGQLCQQHWPKENTSANEVFFSVLPTSQSKKNWAPHPVLEGFLHVSKNSESKKTWELAMILIWPMLPEIQITRGH